MPPPKVELAGKTYGMLTVLRRSKIANQWICRCECGVTTDVLRNNLVSGKTRSCGCLKRKKFHGLMRKAFFKRSEFSES